MQAIIPAAGLGTRLLPFSAAVSKEMAPIGTLPAIQWVLTEALAAGVTRAAVVVAPHKGVLERFLRGDFPPSYLAADAIRDWLRVLEKIEITTVEQPRPVGLGDALLRGRGALAADVSYLMYPDNLVVDGPRLFWALLRLHEESGLCCVAGKADKPYFRGNNFVVAGERRGEGYCIDAFTRRDAPRPAGQIWRAAGRALVTDEFFAGLESAAPGAAGRELDDIDAYDPLARSGRLLGLPPLTPIFDAGSAAGYAEAWEALLAGKLSFK